MCVYVVHVIFVDLCESFFLICVCIIQRFKHVSCADFSTCFVQGLVSMCYVQSAIRTSSLCSEHVTLRSGGREAWERRIIQKPPWLLDETRGSQPTLLKISGNRSASKRQESLCF